MDASVLELLGFQLYVSNLVIQFTSEIVCMKEEQIINWCVGVSIHI